MILFFSILVSPPFLILFSGYFVLVIVIAVAIVLQQTGIIGPEASLAAAAVVVLVAIVAGVKAAHSWLKRSRGWVMSLDEASSTAGPKGAGLLLLGRLQVPVPPTLVLPERLLRDVVEGRGRMLKKAAETVVRFGQLHGVDRFIVRSSFGLEDGRQLFPGVFRSIGGVSAGDQAAVAGAIGDVAASYGHEAVERYRVRSGAERTGGSSAILLQPHIQHDLHGHVGSCDPTRRRLDLVRVEVSRPGTNEIRAADYSVILNRFVGEGLPDGMIRPDTWQRILTTLKRVEGALRGPSILEFGIIDDRAMFYQARRLPDIEPREVWTNVGPLVLNPEPLTSLERGISYGPDLEFLESSLGEDTAAASGARPASPIPCALIRGRPMFQYNDVAGLLRFSSSRRTTMSLFARGLSLALTREPGNGDAPSIYTLRALMRLQSRIAGQQSAWTGFQSWAEHLRKDNPGFRPIVPWDRALSRLLRWRAERAGRRRDELRRRIIERLAAYRQRGRTWPGGATERAAFLSLDEWDESERADRCVVDEEVLGRREQEWRELIRGVSESVVVDEEYVEGEGAIHLSRLVKGEVKGTCLDASALTTPEQAEGAILLFPDSSLRWAYLLPRASGVLLVGGSTLSHVSLQIVELGIPALMGLSAHEAEALVGQTVWIRADRPAVEVIST